MKTIAMYLPQFHRTKENDQWWGEGFTDWVSAKNAKPLFDGHYQPHEPLDDNYYDLLDKKTMKWQSELARKYDIDGFCLYHYWFKDGRTILEKPAENLLKWKDIDIEFCFSWDSTAWARTWTRTNSNGSWASTMEDATKIVSSKDSGLLIDQQYGREEEWKKHFMYLLSFFKDNRYIKLEGKPVFIFYSASLIYCLDDMVYYWNSLAKNEGLPGIYSIVVNCDDNLFDNIDAHLIQEPGILTNDILNSDKCHKIFGAKLVDYDLLWDKILSSKYSHKKVYYGCLVDFDNTARKKPSFMMQGANPKKYEENLLQLYKKNYASNSEFVFINAWNEWGEGMHLEPDKLHGFAYLEATRNAKLMFKQGEKSLVEDTTASLFDRNMVYKHKMSEYFALMNEWMFKFEDEKAISSYFLKNKFIKIAIYGYGHMAKHLIFQLQNTGIEIMYIIEQKKPNNSIPFPNMTLDDKLEQVDAVIVTPFLEYNEVKKILKKQLSCPIISIKEVVMEL